jgi:hypothetical protein
MIIYGWGYFNRRDHSVIRETCPACNEQGHFESYTASKFFTLYFVPVIPLGSEKIISQCPHCKRALTMPQRKWTKLKKTELAQLAGAYSHLCLDKEADAVYLDAVGLSSDEAVAAAANAHIELQKRPKPKPPHRLLQSLPVMIIPAILVLLAGSYLQKAVNSRPEDAFLVSGLDHPYTVLINGKQVTLKPHQRIQADMLVFGENKIEPAGGYEFIPGSVFEIDVPWYKRAFDNSLVVVNPDQGAILLWERTGYAYPKPRDNETGHGFRLSGGQSCHVYPSIDYPFQIFPATIQTPADGTVVYRTRVSDMNKYEPQKIVQLLLEEKQERALHSYLRAKLRSPQSDTTTIHLGASLLPREQFLALAEPRLATRPVEIEWHRAYQTLVENTPEGAGLVDRYRTLAMKEPDNSTLTYLYGRIVDDIEEGRSLFEQSVQMKSPSAHAANALAYYHLLEGNFTHALRYSDLALKQEQGNKYFQKLRNDALLGSHQYDTLEKETGNLLATPSPGYDTFYEHIYRLGKMGRAEEAEKEIPRFLNIIGKLQPMDTTAWRQGEAYLKSALACAQQDPDRLAINITLLDGKGWEFQKAVLTKNLTQAMTLAENDPSSAGLPGRLALYILLARSNQTEAAEAQLKAIIAELNKGVSDQKRWAGWLSGEVAPDPHVAAHTAYDSDLHYLYLTALSQKHPARAEDYLGRAKRIKMRDSFYSLAIGSL